MSSDKKTWWKGQKGEYYVLIQFVIFALILAAPFVINRGQRWPDPWSQIALAAGLLAGSIGGLLVLAGLVSLGRNLAAVPHPKDDATLVISGAYRLVRHPIYSGLILGSFGWGLLMNSLVTLLLAALLFFFFDIKSRREEKWLALKFADYPTYQKTVRKLVPFIY